MIKFARALHAVSMAPNKVVSSVNSGLSIVTSDMKRFKVTPVASHTSSKTGGLVLFRITLWRDNVREVIRVNAVAVLPRKARINIDLVFLRYDYHGEKFHSSKRKKPQYFL